MRINKRMCINDEAAPIEESRPGPGGELWDRKGAEWHIAAEANWALCSHSMEAGNVEQKEGGRVACLHNVSWGIRVYSFSDKMCEFTSVFL